MFRFHSSFNFIRLPFSHQLAHAVVFAICAAALLIAVLFMEHYLGLAPCPLCIVDRFIVAVIGVVALAACAHNPAATGQRIYAGANAVFALLGVGVSARHIWLQEQASGFLGGCAPGMDFLIDGMPFSETLWTIFNAPGDCSEVSWTFLGLSIPWQTLLLFVLLALFNLFIALAAPTARAGDQAPTS